MKNFNLLWGMTIKPLIDFIAARDEKIQSTYSPEKELDTCKNVESKYNCLRVDTKKDLMRFSKGVQLDDIRLDRHKLCACIYIALAESNLLEVLWEKEDRCEKDRLTNARMAFVASCKILSFFILDDALDNAINNPGFEAFLKAQKTLCFPESKNSDSYMVQTIKSLCHAQRHGKLNVLKLANIFYLLEIYTESVYKLRQCQSQPTP